MSAPVRVTPVDGVIEEIRVAMARRRWSQRALAEAIGEPEHWVSRRLNNKVDLSVSELFRIAAALGVEAHALLPRRGQATVKGIMTFPARRSLLSTIERRTMRLTSRLAEAA